MEIQFGPGLENVAESHTVAVWANDEWVGVMVKFHESGYEHRMALPIEQAMTLACMILKIKEEKPTKEMLFARQDELGEPHHEYSGGKL